MSRFDWFTSSSGVVFVRGSPGALPIAPVPSPTMATMMDHVIADWGDLCAQQEARTGVSRFWLLAMIARESGGNPNACNSRDNPPGLGLLQITSTSLYRGYTRAQVMDPRLNTTIGANFLRDIVRHQGPDADLPSVASVYNAGGVGPSWRPHPETDFTAYPWGYHETRGHILAEVAFSNYATAEAQGKAILLTAAAPLDDAAIARAIAVRDASLDYLVGEVLDDEDERARRERLAQWEEEATRPDLPIV